MTKNGRKAQEMGTKLRHSQNARQGEPIVESRPLI
jgi:hypothetical protein